ncbi:hypothetical protein LOZ65_004242 [Ophidiomyces ophidiicola]|nr:hypothetical protein LOZ65_004242 [Ophidiomyces ophidiicola]
MAKIRSSPPWPAEAWAKAKEAYSRNGHFGPKISYIVIISRSGPYTSAEKLQLAIESSTSLEPQWVHIGYLGQKEEDTSSEKVLVCEIEPAEWRRISKTAKTEGDFVWYGGKIRLSYVVGPLGSRSEVPAESQRFLRNAE